MMAAPSHTRRSKEERDRDRLAQRARHAEAKQQADEAREARRREEAARVEEERRQHERGVDAAYVHYQRVRNWAARMRTVAPLPLTETERRIAAALAPLWDADRATIGVLRRWCDPLAGAPAAEPEFPPAAVERMRRQVEVLKKQGSSDILVPEATTLGNAGLVIRHQLHSAESIKHAYAAAALSDGAVLPALRSTALRRVAWEIGGGWGGFGYHLKSLCPNLTYVITGIPERLLVAAVYLMSVFPAARFRLHGESDDEPLWSEWEQVDFIFAVEGTADAPRPPRLDVTLDLDELRHMTPDRAAAQVDRSYDWGSAYFYSMLPCPVADEASTPWSLVERWYWPHPVPRRAERSMQFMREMPRELDFEHLVGWRRLRP